MSVNKLRMSDNIGDKDFAYFKSSFSPPSARTSSRATMSNVDNKFENTTTKRSPSKKQIASSKNVERFSFGQFGQENKKEFLNPLQTSSKDLLRYKLSSRNLKREEKKSESSSLISFTKPTLKMNMEQPGTKVTNVTDPDSILHRLRTENDVKEPIIKDKILRAINSITTDLQKERKTSSTLNRPIVQYDNKAELKFDMNYVMQTSPFTHFSGKLVTLNELQKEKIFRKINEKNTKIEVFSSRARTERLDNDDSFFDFKVGGLKNSKFHKVQ